MQAVQARLLVPMITGAIESIDTTYLETFTKMNVFCDDRVFMTVASSAVSRLEGTGVLSRESSDVFECPDEPPAESSSS